MYWCADCKEINLWTYWQGRGNLDAKIMLVGQDWADHDKGYFRELANIIEPKVILCLGRSTFEGVLSAFDIPLPTRIKNFNSFIEGTNNPVSVPLENGGTAYVFALAHCGAMGTLNRNSKKCADLGKQLEDWRRIKPYLDN